MKTSYIVLALLVLTILLNLIFFSETLYQLDNPFIYTVVILLITCVGFAILQGVLRRHSQKKGRKSLRLKTH